MTQPASPDTVMGTGKPSTSDRDIPSRTAEWTAVAETRGYDPARLGPAVEKIVPALPTPRRIGIRVPGHSAAGGVITLICRWWRRASGRHQLSSLNGRLREDIGVRYEDAWKEHRKWFWRS